MDRAQLVQQIKKKRSFLCVGLDTDLEKIPEHLKNTEDPLLDFNKKVVDATVPYTVAYKPNIAFYEALGSYGISALKETISYIKTNYPEVFVILDAKRGDIGNTSDMYAKSAFDFFKADAITVAPYMGSDSVIPFLQYPEKWVVLLALTSNKGSEDFQHLIVNPETGERLFERTIRTALTWGDDNNLMFVVGATQSKYIEAIRDIAPKSFLLVPGIGAQGGDFEEVCKYGMNEDCGLLVNVSRSLIYCDSSTLFEEKIVEQVRLLQIKMETALREQGFSDSQ